MTPAPTTPAVTAAERECVHPEQHRCADFHRLEDRLVALEAALREARGFIAYGCSHKSRHIGCSTCGELADIDQALTTGAGGTAT